MKKDVTYIKLLKRPLIQSSQGQDDAYRGWFNYRAESLVEINPSFLMKPLGDESSFLSRHGAISVAFDFVNPTTPNKVLIRAWRNEGPGVLPLKSIKLRSHGRTPSRDFGSNSEAWWFGLKIVNGG
jgi:hypothetical protein